jgi:hypothetical protein
MSSMPAARCVASRLSAIPSGDVYEIFTSAGYDAGVARAFVLEVSRRIAALNAR